MSIPSKNLFIWTYTVMYSRLIADEDDTSAAGTSAAGYS